MSNIRLNKDFVRLFKEVFISTWEKEMERAMGESVDYGKRAVELKEKQNQIYEKWKGCKSPLIKDRLEKEMEELENENSLVKKQRDNAEYDDADYASKINYALYFMEHFGELIDFKRNFEGSRALFPLLFDTPPTFTEIQNGTPKLSLAFDICKEKKMDKKHLVEQMEIHWNSIVKNLFELNEKVKLIFEMKNIGSFLNIEGTR